MIIFYPRNIGRWRDHFDFNPDITLTPKINFFSCKPSYEVFRDRAELIEFCKGFGVRMDDAEFPFEIVGPIDHPSFGVGTYTVKQWTVLGWIKDNFK